MIDKAALYSISAGMYVFTALDGDRPIGRMVDAVAQIAAEPKRVSVSLMKTGHTAAVMSAAGVGARFSLTTLAQSAPLAVVEAFGYQSSADADKFLGLSVAADEAGVPYVTDGAVARMSCVVFDLMDMGSHWLLLADVVEAQVFSREDVMTYAGYRALKKAATAQPAAEAASAPAPAEPAKPRIGWRCMICGYTIEVDELPDDFTCPRCGMGKDAFERVEL